MGRNFRFDRCPYEENEKIFEKGSVTFEPGVTVLVGCNGSGKTTLLNTLREKLKKDHIPALYLDTLNEAKDSFGKAIWNDNIALAASSLCSSEGERMMLSIGQFAGTIREFVRTGQEQKDRLASLFSGETEKEITSKERWILIDSADSGLSIDALCEVRDFLNLIVEDAAEMGVEIYVVVSTNQYEFVVDNKCIDVQTLKPVSIKTYNKYRSVIMRSRERKNKRVASQ